MRIKQTSRARGGNRGGIGGGYERLDPDWDIKRLQRLRTEYLDLNAYWRKVYMKGLPAQDRYALTNILEEKDKP